MRTRKDYLLGSTMAVGAAAMSMAMLVPAAAVAQDAGEDATQVEEIVVVGSRIRRDNYNAPSPTQVVTREEATLQGFASTTEALQSNAITGGTSQITNAFGGYVTNGGPGANTIGLRGMGPSRTLVLLNGRRVSPAGSRGSVGAADLNVLPTAMIDRVEVLRDGASSVYGSDAVAGVVNIQTRKNVDHLTVEAQFNAPMDADGNGGSQRYSVTGGMRGDRWRMAGSAERYTRDGLSLRDRSFTQCNTDGFRDGSDFIDPATGKSKCYPITDTGSNGVTINTIGTNMMPGVAAAGTTATSFNRWRPNAAVTEGLVGYEGVGGTGSDINVRDTFEDRMLNESLISPVEITTLYGEAGYQLNALGNAELYGEMLYNNRRSQQTGYRQLVLDYAKGSPLIPSALSMSTAMAADQGLSKGLPVGVRAFIGFGNDVSKQEVDFNRYVAGIKGDFLIPDWRYDAYVSFSKSKSTYKANQFLTDLMAESLDVVETAPGQFACAELAALPGCVAAPALTAEVVGGVLPQDWLDFVYRPVIGTTEYKETVAAIGLDGPLFLLPAGQVMGFFGAEIRKSEIDDTPGLDSQTGNTYNMSSSGITRGSDQVWEVFGEVEVPVLMDKPFARELTFNGSFRYTDYDSYGDDTTYKVGLVYKPVDGVTLRGTYGTSYRAPALFEQFVGATTGFLSSTGDRCNEYGIKDVNPNRVANCAAEGLAADFENKSSIQVVTSGGADAGLAAETSTNMTIGLVLQPTLPNGWGDLAFAVDYYEIEVSNGVSRTGASQILTRCYDSNPEDFAANVGFCRLVERDAADNSLTVYDSYINLATDNVKGLDYTVRYRNDFGPGSLLVNLGLTQYTEVSSKLFADDPLEDYVGMVENPEFTGSFDVSYAWDQWRVRYGIEYVDAMDSYDYYEEDRATSAYDLATGSYQNYNVSVQYHNDSWTVTAGIRNLWNEDPQTVSAGFTSRVGNAPLYSAYDYVGRTAFLNLNKTF